MSRIESCQGLNHVKSNCYKTARCVKYAGYHHTKDGTKDRSTESKCANCGSGHTANYRGCMVAVELQRLRDNARKGKQRELNSQKKSIKELQAAQRYRQAEKSKLKQLLQLTIHMQTKLLKEQFMRLGLN